MKCKLLFIALLFTFFQAESIQAQLFWASPGNQNIERSNLDGSSRQGLVTSLTSFGIALDKINNKLYWINQGASKIERSDLDGSNREDVVDTGIGSSPFGIALDLTNNKVYWTATGTRAIRRSNLDGTDIEDVVTTGLLNPVAIALDIDNNKVYWVDQTAGVVGRANFDGTMVENNFIAGLNAPAGIALDLVSNKIYWTNNLGGTIGRSNLDGTMVENNFVTGLNTPFGIALDLINNKIYWTSQGEIKIERSDLDGSNKEDVVTGINFPTAIAVCPPCSITNPAAGTPSCSGNNATFNVTFTQSGGSGSYQVLDGTTVVGTDTSSPISVTITGPTTSGSKTLTIRDANNTSCSNTVNVTLPTCPPPCSITNPAAGTPSCSGNNATLNVTFTPNNGSGSYQVLDGTTVVGTGTSSPIAVTITGPTTSGSKTLTIRDVNNTSCSNTVNVTLPTCPPPCSITNPAAGTPSCSGNNATLNVTFTPNNGSGSYQVLDGTTVVGTGTSSPIAVTITGPTTSGSKTLTIRDVNNTSCSNTVNVNIPSCPSAVTALNIESGNELRFQDPCDCDAPRNCPINGVTYFHDTLTVTDAAGRTNLNITIAAGATGFFSQVECFSLGGITLPAPAGTAIPHVGGGVYKLEFWRPSGVIPTLQVVESGTTVTVPASTFSPACTDAACAAATIPTMSEWGLLIFGLLVLNLGVYAVRRRELLV